MSLERPLAAAARRVCLEGVSAGRRSRGEETGGHWILHPRLLVLDSWAGPRQRRDSGASGTLACPAAGLGDGGNTSGLSPHRLVPWQLFRSGGEVSPVFGAAGFSAAAVIPQLSWVASRHSGGFRSAALCWGGSLGWERAGVSCSAAGSPRP